jgi:hypothetical protein
MSQVVRRENVRASQLTADAVQLGKATEVVLGTGEQPFGHELANGLDGWPNHFSEPITRWAIGLILLGLHVVKLSKFPRRCK